MTLGGVVVAALGADRKPPPTPVLRTALRVLFFRASRDELLALDRRHLIAGLAATWLVGIGRYWDSSRAGPFQKAGLGSVAYVLLLSGFLWFLLMPLRPRNWSWPRLLTFLTLLSPPALINAVPVEAFTSLETAQALDASFLVAVGAWRVALLVWFLRRAALLPRLSVVVGSMLPIALIVTALTMLNPDHAMYDFMAGVRPDQRSAADLAYAMLWILTVIAWAALPVLLIGYVALAGMRFREARRGPKLRVAATGGSGARSA